MSLPDPPPARKPRRLGLYLPFGALAVLIVVWSGYWLNARNQLVARLDAAPGVLVQAGYPVTWKSRRVGGYPFRLDVSFTDFRARGPGGWGLETPLLEAEAQAYDPTRWMLATPKGLTFVRPVAGPVTVTGKLIRASLTHPTARPPSVSFEGVDLVFQPAPDAQPFSLTKAARVELHTRAGPDDEGGVFVRIDAGQARLSGLFARIADGKPVSAVWNATLSKMSGFSGRDWPGAVRAWTAAGGRMTVRNAGVTAGDALVNVTRGDLGADPDGRLSGALTLSLRDAPKGLDALSGVGVIPPEAADAAGAVARARQADGPVAQADLSFQAGRTLFGPVSLGPAPKVYDPR